MQPAMRTIKIHSQTQRQLSPVCVCVYSLLLSFAVSLFGSSSSERERGRQLYLVITHVAASLGTICSEESESAIGSCISTSMSELFEDSSRSLSLISITSSIRSRTSKLQFLFLLFLFTLFALRQQLFLSVCVLWYLLLHANEKVAFLLLWTCFALRWAVVFCLLSVDF